MTLLPYYLYNVRGTEMYFLEENAGDLVFYYYIKGDDRVFTYRNGGLTVEDIKPAGGPLTNKTSKLVLDFKAEQNNHLNIYDHGTTK